MEIPRSARQAFTLVEILVVVAILALLMALALPATFYAWNRYRRMACASHFRQLGLAIGGYEAANDCLPMGRVTNFPDLRDAWKVSLGLTSTPETPWSLLLLPHLELDEVAVNFNYERGVFGAFRFESFYVSSGVEANWTIMSTRIGTFLCPSDSESFYEAVMEGEQGPELRFFRGNYAASWGNTNWNQDQNITGNGTQVTEVRVRRSAFGPRVVRPSDFHHGKSNVVTLSEVLQGEGSDFRGIIWFALPGSSHYMSRLPPNGTSDYFHISDRGDRLPFGICKNVPPHLPCVSVQQSSKAYSSTYAAARSRHSGGVNVLYGDGRVTFVANDVDEDLWVSMHAMD